MTNLTSAELHQYLNVATAAATEGGAILRKYWGKLSSVREKKYHWDLVTEADQESEQVVLEILSKHFPSHVILAEETGLSSQIKNDFVWAVDPLDGTTNYTHQFPMVSVSIGLLFKGTPIVGVVFNPIFNEMFQGAKGLGAKLNGQPLEVSKVNTLKSSLLVTGFPYDRENNKDNNYPEFCHLTNIAQGVRRIGSAAIDLAYVAAGRLDGYWERGLQPWDLAAGVLLIEEAGGKVSSYDLSPFDVYAGRTLATNGLIHEQLSQELKIARNKS